MVKVITLTLATPTQLILRLTTLYCPVDASKPIPALWTSSSMMLTSGGSGRCRTPPVERLQTEK